MKAFQELRLVMNPYNLCVWNVYVKGKQLTILFHIDDLMISYVSSEVVMKYIKLLERKYGSKDLLIIT